jgi:hypothetical protein
MFDDEELERRKAMLLKKKNEAMDRVKLPPLTGNHSEPGKTVSMADLASENEMWLYNFTVSEPYRNRFGVKTMGKEWVIFDEKLFNQTVTGEKRDMLRKVWKARNATT